jgi:hypothetical protein
MTSANFKKTFAVLLLLSFLLPGFASAHQPRVIQGRQTVVTEPEISKAYYGQLTGVPDTFTIQASASFNLYVNVLVPDIAGQKKDISATITKDGKPLVALDGMHFTWTKMFEPFGYDTYWVGPEYKAKAEAGTYVVTVTSSSNDSKYSVAIGETEKFDFKEIMNALAIIPHLKSGFFNESPISFVLSPFGWGLIIVLYLLAGIVGLIYRFVLKKLAKNSARKVRKNIGTLDRLLRLVIGVALLFWAITTDWNLFIIFFSGFAVFEAVFSWCGFYAALGKNTCKIN